LAQEVRGLGVAELRRLRQLEEENRKLKQLVVDPGSTYGGSGPGDARRPSIAWRDRC